MDVLVVDDDEDVRLLFELYLRGRDHVATAVGSAAAARAALAEHAYDVLCLDVELPDAAGADLVRELRTSGALPDHVVLVSGLHRTPLEHLAGELGVVPLGKPFTVADLDELFARLDG